MIDLITQHRPEIVELCRKYGVRRLELFGSAARGDFDAGSSDIDFLVIFDRIIEFGPADQFFGLLEQLEALLGRKVDLVNIRAAINPYFLADALKHRHLLYAA